MNACTFENAVLSAINLGGDADTVGACCGALAGAYWGMMCAGAVSWAGVRGFTRLIRICRSLWEMREDSR